LCSQRDTVTHRADEWTVRDQGAFSRLLLKAQVELKYFSLVILGAFLLQQGKES